MLKNILWFLSGATCSVVGISIYQYVESIMNSENDLPGNRLIIRVAHTYKQESECRLQFIKNGVICTDLCGTDTPMIYGKSIYSCFILEF